MNSTKWMEVLWIWDKSGLNLTGKHIILYAVILLLSSVFKSPCFKSGLYPSVLFLPYSRLKWAEMQNKLLRFWNCKKSVNVLNIFYNINHSLHHAFIFTLRLSRPVSILYSRYLGSHHVKISYYIRSNVKLKYLEYIITQLFHLTDIQ